MHDMVTRTEKTHYQLTYPNEVLLHKFTSSYPFPATALYHMRIRKSFNPNANSLTVSPSIMTTFIAVRKTKLNKTD